MLMGIIGGFFKGRYVCGWLCPRGAFLERIVARVSPDRPIPQWLRRPAFRWAVFAALMGFMAFQIAQNPGDVYHWGRVFVRICIITTGIGVVLALIVHPRTWCSFCPMGTMQSAVGGNRAPLIMADGCVECRTCERACPMNLSIVGQRMDDGRVDAPDCLKCGECVVACPKGLLRL
jgi:polyferredoxin